MVAVEPRRTTSGAESSRPDVRAWVDRIARLARPDAVRWCDGSDVETAELLDGMVDAGTIEPLDPVLRPRSYLARSAPSDVARVEARTFICSEREADAGPTNNWRDPELMRAELRGVFDGAMRGRTMYVVPFAMGPIGSPMTRYGIEITDSPYVVVSMGVMTRAGAATLRAIDDGADWVPAVHSVGYPLVLPDDGAEVRRADVPWPCDETKYVVHFPESREIWSYGSGYGGNALLGKKCYALRIASVMARDEGWLAEHMLLLRVTSPAGRVFHVAAAFPSACGKTNLAMLRPTIPGWQVETLGDDIAWLVPRRAPDGRTRLYAINPEAGFFGVAPGTSVASNPVAMQMLASDVVFTNVARTADGDVWWEGMTATEPPGLIDWHGRARQDLAASSGTGGTADDAADDRGPAAHPNSRFTVAATRCPTLAADWDDPGGVPLDAILFGGRRRSRVPLVWQARSWAHGVFTGATISSERTAAAEGTVGELRRDPFAMLPFCGYAMTDHWAHWLAVGDALGDGAPAIFGVNWFRRDAAGAFLWPGFGENSRVLEWVLDRVAGEAPARETPVGWVPERGGLRLDGIDVSEDALEELLAVTPEEWAAEADSIAAYFDSFDAAAETGGGYPVPAPLRGELAALRARLADGAGDAGG
ncbi:phosphoenolpyruvate carboxykinase (GTP) [Beutenbergia cavernae]|nr:phosphoenolpyruvate carboxykinase (GTP) [Beutenbergia cavernae]